jgi:hypothetical protein
MPGDGGYQSYALFAATDVATPMSSVPAALAPVAPR